MQFAKDIKGYTCICCPLGCSLEVEFDEEGEVSGVFGYSCERGRAYAVQETTNPVRMVTTLLSVPGFLEPLSVKTKDPVPKNKIPLVLEAIQKLQVKAPIHIGQELIEDVCDTGVAVVASKELC